MKEIESGRGREDSHKIRRGKNDGYYKMNKMRQMIYIIGHRIIGVTILQFTDIYIMIPKDELGALL